MRDIKIFLDSMEKLISLVIEAEKELSLAKEEDSWDKPHSQKHFKLRCEIAEIKQIIMGCFLGSNYE